VDQLAARATGLVDREVAVLDQERDLERRPLGEAELALARVPHDPQPCQSGVDLEPGHAHHVVVVPEQRRALVHRVLEERSLAGSAEVFGPAIGGRRGETSVEMDDGMAGERGRVRVGRTAAQAWDALHGDPVWTGAEGSPGHDDRKLAPELVAPLDRDGLAALGLDRRAREAPVVRPDPRLGQVAVEPVRSWKQRHGEPALVRRRDQAPRQGQSVHERF